MTGILDLHWAGVLLATLALTHVTIAAVTIYLHRCQAHRAVDLHPVVAHFFRFWLWLTTGMITREWVAVHRKHHARCETEEDPHSPRVRGIGKILLEGAEVYRESAHDPEVVAGFSHGCPDDWVERNLYLAHPVLGIVLMFVIDVLLFGALGITVWAVQMFWIPFFAAGVINGVGHFAGYRNFEPADASRNIVPIGILIGGEELHNNHHAHASSARFSSKWWEFDVGWFYIRLLAALGLARVRRLAPRSYVRRDQKLADLETVRAFAGARMQVLAHYARDVLRSVYQEELRGSRGDGRVALKSIRGLLVREESLLDDNARDRLATVLAGHRTLATVIEYRRQLQRIWAQKTASPESLLASLQQWCREAEATGIEALAEFAGLLRGYALARGT